ncbi:hypothetical protein [Pseudonocardia halophobica]|uniref:hypothetical protein n=1 Tax=Pseudonocardia halophobica TaxID=29401 RepID=UPI0005620C20|nr:hypothetical protein [Pseudonocardia halophobica]
MSEVAVVGPRGVSVGRTGRTGPVVRWTAAVALGGQGRYAAAAALLEDLVRDPRVPVEVRAHALVTRASHLRQRGGHAFAERFDGQALALVLPVLDGAADLGAAPARGPAAEDPSEARGPRPAACETASRGAAVTGGPGPSGGADADRRADPGQDPVAGATGPASPCADLLSARVDALTGLAADALGQGHLDRSVRLLSRADAVLAAGVAQLSSGAGPWRPAVRADWVRAELALARGDLDGAATAAVRAVRGAAAAGSPRHLVKSRLLAAVVAAVRAGRGHDGLAESGEGVVAPTPEAALAALDAVAEDATAAGLLPLAWAALLAAADAAATVARHTAVPRTPSSPDICSHASGKGRGGGTPSGSRKPPDGFVEGPPRPSRVGDPPGATVRPPDPSSERPERHDRRPDRLLRSTIGAPNGSARRRHAAAATLSVIRARSEGAGRRLMGGGASG